MKTTTAHPRPVRLISLLVTMLMVASLAVVQASPAAASASGWARLVAGVNVLPGTAQYAVQVETQATAVNTVVVAVPAGIGITATDAIGVTVAGGDGTDLGFTGTVQTVGSFQRVIFTAPEGVSIPANSNAVLRFNADVTPPTAATERSGTFKVSLSSNGGNSFETATTGARDPRTSGTLTTTIKFLEVVKVDVVGPTGVVDMTGTEGQRINVRTTLKNYAQIPVRVSAGLGASSPRGFTANERISDPVDVELLGGGQGTANFTVDLGTAVNNDGDAADRTVTFSGSITEAVTGATGFGASTDKFTVQILGRISFDGATFDPRIVSPGAATFVVDAEHSGTPSFDVALGAADVSFADTKATNQQAYSFAKDADAQTLSFTGQVKGADADYPVTATYMATDENGYSYMQTIGLTESGFFGPSPVEVTIDALAPDITTVVNLPSDADGRAQEAAKDGDSITVNGTIDDDNAVINEVRLVANGQVVAVKRTEQISRRPLDDTYSVTFSGEEVKFPGGIGQFVAATVAVDRAGNLGVAFSGATDFDNVVPRLTFARVESTIDVNQSLLGQVGREAGVISVRFQENALIRGGCNPNQYSIDGQNVVREVRMSDNSPCLSGAASDDNWRLLILSVPVERESTPLVRYSPIPGDRVGDFAGNLAPEDTVTAVSGIVPVAPDLLDVYRNTANKTPEECQADAKACEDAYQQGSGSSAVYWTRFAGGDDTVVCVAGARPGYSVEVTDKDGNTIVGTSQPITDTTPCVRVPIGSNDTTYVRGIRFRNSAGAGEVLYLNIALDTVLPKLTNVVRDGNRITVSFNDVLVEGNNSSLNWLVYERLADGSRVAGPPNSVSNGGDAFTTDRTKRVLTGSFEENGEYIGVGYVFFSGTRYGDRGGNKLANAPGPVNGQVQ